MNQGSKYEQQGEDDNKPIKPKNVIETVKGLPIYVKIGIGAAIVAILVFIAIIVARFTAASAVGDNFMGGLFGGNVAQEEDDPNYDPYANVESDLEMFDDGSVTASIDDWFTDWERQILYYTGVSETDMQNAINNFTEFDVLLRKAETERDAKLRERYIELREEMLNSASPEYKEVLSKTWLANEYHEVIIPNKEYKPSKTRRENRPFEKIPSHGPQLNLMMVLTDGSTVFIPIKPERWVELEDTGFMVVDITYVEYNGVEYITEIKEMRW